MLTAWALMVVTIHQAHPNAKVFLMAESMGGIFALNYAKTNPTDISGMILMSPVFKLARAILALGRVAILRRLRVPSECAGAGSFAAHEK